MKKRNIRIVCIFVLFFFVLVYLFFHFTKTNRQNEIKPESAIKQEDIKTEEEDKMPTLRIQIGDKNFTGTLYDNETTREWIKQMPLSISMKELNGNEKYCYLNQTLPTKEEKVENIKSGDLMLYGSNCIVLFYKNFTTTYSYTKLGTITNPSDLEKAVGTGNISILFSIDS